MPCVCVYELRSASIAAIAARLIGAATGKSGWPIERLIGSLRLRARSKIRRMPLESMRETRAARGERGMVRRSVLPGEQRKAQSWKLEAGSWKLEAGSWKLEAGSWKLEAGSWKLEAGSWKLEAGSWKLEAGSWKLEAGSWKLEAGSWKAPIPPRSFFLCALCALCVEYRLSVVGRRRTVVSGWRPASVMVVRDQRSQARIGLGDGDAGGHQR